MAIDVNISGLNTVVDVTMAQTAPIDADSGQVIVIKDYNNLLNKPSINGVTLLGNKDSSDIGVADASHTHTTTDITDFPSLATVAVSGDYDDLANTPAIHNVPSGGNAGQVLAKNSNTDYDLKWVNQSGGGGGASAFVAEFNVTPYADVKDAYDEDAIILCTVDDNGNTVVLQLAYFDAGNEAFNFAQPHSDGWYWTALSNGVGWDDGFVQFASTDTATALRDGLMSALDYQKLSAIESGAEVNVQSDWSQSDNTKDDFIKNKPTLFSGSYNDLTNKPTIPDAVSVTRYTTSGTNIADLTIGNTTTKLYAPTGGGGGGTVTDVWQNGSSVLDGTVGKVNATLVQIVRW